MKRINILFFVALVVVFGACQKLDRELTTDLSLQQVENSFNNLQQLLNGVYAETREGFLEIGGEAMMASATDEAEHTIEASSVQLLNQGAWNAINNPANVWGEMYRGIRRANIFVETASPDKVNLDAFRNDATAFQQKRDEVSRWAYEARFLRAFFYFELVKRYGGVPLITASSTSEADVAGIRRNALQECFQFISNECDSAAKYLPVSYATGELGRATRGAALALKSRALLYAASDLFNTPSWAGGYPDAALISLTGNRAARWQAAADAAKTVIDLPGTGYALASNYNALFTTFNNAEIIFTRRNSSTNVFERVNYPIGFEGRSGTTPTQDLVDAYEVKVNATTSVPFDWSNPLHAADPYSGRDPRLGMTILTNNVSFTANGGTRPVETWTGGRDARPLVNASKTGYYLRKYVANVNLLTNTTAVHSWIHFRLAEIYLNYAEALNEVSPGHADIKRFYDLVRNRTGVAMPLLPGGLSQEQVRERIRNERRVELAFEDHRAWDVRRWMTAPAALGTAVRGVEVTNTANSFTYTPVVVENRVFQPKMYLFPIPQNELSISGGLKQNPMW